MAAALEYLNTDLELRADFDLRALVTALTEAGLFWLTEETLNHGFAVMEANTNTTTAIDSIEAMLAAVEALPNVRMQEWQRCTSRVFDIGFQSGATPRTAAAELSPALLRRLADVGAAVGITVYALETQATDDRSTPTMS